MKQLLLVEGLPGTGKTTLTQKLLEHFVSRGEIVTALFEGDERIPGDFYETAGIPVAEYDSYRFLNPNITEDATGCILRTTNYVYLRLDRCSDLIEKSFRRWDMGNERNRQVGIPHYIACALERLEHWAAVNTQNENTMIIDSGFLQNPINELLFRAASDDEVSQFIKSISERLRSLHPLCVYLKRESAGSAISFAKQAKGADWSARVDSMLREMDCPDLFERRFRLELELLPCVPHIVCSISGKDWSDADRQILQL